MIQEIAQAAVDTVHVLDSENTGRRDIILAVIAAMVTVITTIGPIFINRWMDKLKEERELAAKTVSDAAVIVATKAQIVADKVEEVKNVAAGATDGIAALQVTADATHKLVDGRYSEIREELKRSNEIVQRMTLILQNAGIVPPDKAMPSGIVAEPQGDRRTAEEPRREDDPPLAVKEGE